MYLRHLGIRDNRICIIKFIHILKSETYSSRHFGTNCLRITYHGKAYISESNLAQRHDRSSSNSSHLRIWSDIWGFETSTHSNHTQICLGSELSKSLTDSWESEMSHKLYTIHIHYKKKKQDGFQKILFSKAVVGFMTTCSDSN